MKIKETITALALAAVLVGGASVVASAQGTEQTPKKSGGVLGKIFGQDSKAKTTASKSNTSPQSSAPQLDVPPSSVPSSTRAPESLEPDDVNAAPVGVSNEVSANRHEPPEEVAAIAPSYNNFFTSYRIGPEDVISIRVFGQERYSVAGITVPPDGVISHPLIPEGVRVVGKTREQVQKELTKQLDEYIIDPKVTVSIDKSMSYRYGVIGAVAQPGIRLMGRRLTAYEAIMEAGGATNLADKK